MQLKIYQVDAFTKETFGGNPAAVIPLKNWLSDSKMQAIALENNLSETAFFVQEGDTYALRWFTPIIEVDLCGHATLASAHVLFQHLGYAKEEIQFTTKSGVLKVTQAGDVYIMDFPADKAIPTEQPDYLETALGTKVQAFYKGRDDFMAIVSDQNTLVQLQPNFSQLAQLGSRGLLVTAEGQDVDFVSRCFFPQSGIDEDPVTGSAHTLLAPYWGEKLQKDKLTAKQISSRGGNLQCLLKGDRVELLGQAITFMEGAIQFH